MVIASVRKAGGRPPRAWLVDTLGALGTLLLVLFLAYVFVGGALRKSSALASEQVTLTTQLEHLTELASTLGQGEQTLNMLDTGMQELDNRLPLKMDLEKFFNDLMSLAAEEHVSVYEMLPGEILDEDDFVSMPIHLSANAPFENFYDFLFKLRSFERLTKIDTLRISATGEDGDCNLTMTLRIYAAPESTGGNLER